MERPMRLNHSSRRAGRWGDMSGGVADLGVMLPLAAALVLVNGLDPSEIFIAAGLLVWAAGAVFRIPFPVQPLKALTAVAVAGQLGSGVIHAAGIEIGLLLLLLSVTTVAERLARIFEQPVIRSLQFGVGLLLLQTAAKLLTEPSPVFAHAPPRGWMVSLGVLTLGAVALSAHLERYAGLLLWLAVGVGLTVALAGATPPEVSVWTPDLNLPSVAEFQAAFFLLVVPQIPLTFGNAVVAVSSLAQDYFGPKARRVTPSRVCLVAGAGNLLSALAGGMPMCHGAGGLTAHYRLGARTARMNVVLGGLLLGCGLFFGRQVLALFGLLPVWALSGLLAYAGFRHALLVLDLRGGRLGLAVFAGLAGALLGNLAVTSLIALTIHHGLKILKEQEPVSPG